MNSETGNMEILTTLGGLGLFLLGMAIMTQSLKALAGHHIKHILSNLTQTPTSAVGFGALSTALLQSSSATTIAAVGFVSAEIISFTSSLGIIFGANLGTTITGWLVALFGFKFKLGTLVYPLIFIGALCKLFSKDKLAHFGYALAGFGLIFLGINHMQEGMAGMQDILSFEQFPGDSWLSRIELIGFGIIFTIITQSSSAGIAATLTALNADFIVFEQAAALAIGMDIGTTATAAIATVGGSVSTKRTGFSHVIYNLLTAVMALLLITPFIDSMNWLFPTLLSGDPEIGLVAFHTGFNLFGVILIIPFTQKFANMMERLIPEKEQIHTRFLNESLLSNPDLSLMAVEKSLFSHLTALLEVVKEHLNNEPIAHNLAELQISLDQCHKYIDKIHLTPSDNKDWQKLIHSIHIIDHLQRLHERLEEDEDRAKIASKWQPLADEKHQLLQSIYNIHHCLLEEQVCSWQQISIETKHLTKSVEKLRLDLRQQVSEQIGSGKLDIEEGTDLLEAIRWFIRVCYHIHRLTSRIERLEKLS